MPPLVFFALPSLARPPAGTYVLMSTLWCWDRRSAMSAAWSLVYLTMGEPPPIWLYAAMDLGARRLLMNLGAERC
jgi:hypothetical protein